MKSVLFLTLCLLTRSGPAFATEIAEIMHSNAYYSVAGSVGVSTSLLEHAAIRNTEFAVQMNLLEKHNPKLYQELLTARTNYLQNKNNAEAYARYSAVKKSAAKFTQDIRVGNKLKDTAHYERLTLKNLRRLKVGARIWGVGALGLLTYATYNGLANMIQSNQAAKLTPGPDTKATEEHNFPVRPDDLAKAD